MNAHLSIYSRDSGPWLPPLVEPLSNDFSEPEAATLQSTQLIYPRLTLQPPDTHTHTPPHQACCGLSSASTHTHVPVYGSVFAFRRHGLGKLNSGRLQPICHSRTTHTATRQQETMDTRGCFSARVCVWVHSPGGAVACIICSLSASAAVNLLALRIMSAQRERSTLAVTTAAIPGVNGRPAHSTPNTHTSIGTQTQKQSYEAHPAYRGRPH